MVYCLNPTEVRYNGDKAARHSVILLPYTDGYSKVQFKTPDKAPASAVKVTPLDPAIYQPEGEHLYIHAPKMPSKGEELDGIVIFTPYWWVSHTSDKAEANMEFFKYDLSDGELSIEKAIRNTRMLHKGDRLLMYQAPVKDSAAKASAAKKQKTK